MVLFGCVQDVLERTGARLLLLWLRGVLPRGASVERIYVEGLTESSGLVCEGPPSKIFDMQMCSCARSSSADS